MPDLEHKNVYNTQTYQYDLLVAREDYQGNLPRAIREIAPLEGISLLDLGAGTGRVALLCAPYVKELTAMDAAWPMLKVAEAKLGDTPLRRWYLTTADHRALPLVDRSADLVTSGWSVCYLVSWNEGDWRVEVRRALAEMKRVLRPGGTILFMETLGTGHETPFRLEHLAPYYRLLEEEEHFSSRWIRTDYRFESVEEAESLTRFFFGDELADRVARDQMVVLPECTGLWWLKV